MGSNMENLAKLEIQHDIETSLKLNKIVKGIKFLLVVVICWLYVINSAWLDEALIAGILLSLISPMGFFDVFIQRLLKYNTQTIEERQELNATETSQHFENIYSKLEKQDS